MMRFTLKKKPQPGSGAGKRHRYGDAAPLPFEKGGGGGDSEEDGREGTSEGARSPLGRQKKRVVDGHEGAAAGCSGVPEGELAERQSLALTFQEQGDQYAEDGRYREALAKWEAALIVAPGNAVLHEQKAQVLLEIGDAWGAIKAATRAAELEPSWAEAWTTLARAQLNYGEPDASIASFDKALAINPDSEEAKADREIAKLLVKKRKQLHSSGLCEAESRFVVGDKDEKSDIRLSG